MPKKLQDKKWLVVEVRSGIPVSVNIFSKLGLAEKYAAKLRKTMDLEKDETGIFPIEL